MNAAAQVTVFLALFVLMTDKANAASGGTQTILYIWAWTLFGSAILAALLGIVKAVQS